MVLLVMMPVGGVCLIKEAISLTTLTWAFATLCIFSLLEVENVLYSTVSPRLIFPGHFVSDSPATGINGENVLSQKMAEATSGVS